MRRREYRHHHRIGTTLKRIHRYGAPSLGMFRENSSCQCFGALDRPDRLVIELFGNRGTA
jgi:hypothetical protein